MKYLGKIKNRYDDDRIEMPNDIWINKNYRVRFDQTGEWSKIAKYYDLTMASIIELSVIENSELLKA
jgi:hypothetical protein